MRQTLAILTFDTDGPGLLEITDDVTSWLRASDIRMGTVTLFCQHTSAGLVVTENAAPAVRRDLLRWLDFAVPEGDGYEHSAEGSDDMPAHIKAMLTGNSLTIPLADGKMMLGSWQGVFLVEHRHQAHKRYVVAHALGD
jgi:secondary thiamine-phosphate synthase enzyme